MASTRKRRSSSSSSSSKPKTVWATHTEPASRPARTAEDERAAIVTWLRWRASDASPTAEAALLDVADEIDRGEHRRDKP